MPASPIRKKVTLPDNWVQLQKTIIPDQATACYWGVWYAPKETEDIGIAWLMWGPIDDDPSVNDSWGHAEEIDDSCRNVLTAIEAVHGVSFHDCIWVEMGVNKEFPAKPIIPSGPVAIGKGETWDGE